MQHETGASRHYVTYEVREIHALETACRARIRLLFQYVQYQRG